MTQQIQNTLHQIEKKEQKIAQLAEENKLLPRGTMFVRKIGKKSYVYRNKKRKGKVSCEYVGRFNCEKTKMEIEKSKKYKNNILEIKKTEKELEDIYIKIMKKYKKSEEDLTKFAIHINKVDGVAPSKGAQALLKLLEYEQIDLETFETTIRKIYQKKL